MKIVSALLCLAILYLPTLCPGSDSHIRYAGSFTRASLGPHSRINVLFWYDQVEGGEGGWTHGDATAIAEPRFHVDTYLAYPGGTYSYWCGALDPLFASGDGYGNAWDQRLELPPIDLSGTAVEETSWGAIKARFGKDSDAGPRPRTALPTLKFSYRHDSEPGYDFTFVQAESQGVWVDLVSGYSGSSGGWQESGVFDLSGFGNPLRIRFRFVSDGAGSDEDGLYDSDGGAFHVDDIRVFDFASGDVYFYDDCEDGVGLCHGSVPPAAGDWWHITDRSCPAYSDPHSWWCGDDADTSLIPPGLDNWLSTPVVDLYGAISCTAHFFIHLAVPTDEGDYIEFLGTADGAYYHSFGAYWGDFGQCDGWLSAALNRGYDVGQFAPDWPVERAGFKFVFHTNDDGCGPAAGGDAGIMIDDVWFEGETFVNGTRQ